MRWAATLYAAARSLPTSTAACVTRSQRRGADGVIGPPSWHVVASETFIGAGLPNTGENLVRWLGSRGAGIRGRRCRRWRLTKLRPGTWPHTSPDAARGRATTARRRPHAVGSRRRRLPTQRGRAAPLRALAASPTSPERCRASAWSRRCRTASGACQTATMPARGSARSRRSRSPTPPTCMS